MTFGEYIYEKRKKNGFTIRELSGMISASPSYISGIERGTRTAPNSDILKKFSDAFALSDEEEAKMMDLAAKTKSAPTVPSDILPYINENNIVHKAIRTAMQNNISDDEWEKFIEHITNAEPKNYF